MKKERYLRLAGAIALAVLMVSGVVLAQGGTEPQSPQDVTEILGAGFTYQGQLKQGGSPVTDNCEMAFRLYDDASGGAQVGSAITRTVVISDGLFTENLDFGSSAFTGDARWLGIRVKCTGDSDYADLGRQELTAVPYALYALSAGSIPWSGITGAPDFQEQYAQVVVVAKSGGDYTSVQAAIDSISDAAADKPYLVWVAPGVYNETVTMKPYVHLQGAGQDATVITSTASSPSLPPTEATLVLTHHVSLRDLTVGNGGGGSRNAALLATAGTTQTLVANATTRAQGSGSLNYAIFLTGSGTSVMLQDVTALGENGNGNNFGLYNTSGTAAALRGGSFTGRGGNRGYGIYTCSSDTTLEAEGITALGENGDIENYGLYSYDWTATTLRGGSFTAISGTSFAIGIYNYNGATLDATSVTALAENGGANYGLRNHSQAVATLRGGSFTGRGGSNAYGIHNTGSSATLAAESLTVLAENGSTGNRGLENASNAVAMLGGGSFTGSGAGSSSNYGLFNTGGAVATLHAGAFTGRGGNYAYGMSNIQSDSALEIERITALGENGNNNYGLYNGVDGSDTATTNANSSQFIGSDDGLLQGGGTVRLSVSQLDGQATRAAGTLTCFQVYDGSYSAYSCP